MIEKGESNEIQKCCFIFYNRKPFSTVCTPKGCYGSSWYNSYIKCS